MIRAFLIVLFLYTTHASLILQAARKVFRTHDGSYLYDLNYATETNLQNQLKKIIGLSPDHDFITVNMSVIQEISDQRMIELLLQALVGNFTTSAAKSWNQPCEIVINSKSGALEVQDERSVTDSLLTILVLFFCVFQFGQILSKTPGGK